MLSIIFILSDIVSTLLLPSLSICVTFFAIGTEKVLNFSVFSPRHSNCPLKSIIFFACSLKEVQNVFIQSLPRCKECLFSILSKDHIVDIEYSQGIC